MRWGDLDFDGILVIGISLVDLVGGCGKMKDIERKFFRNKYGLKIC